MSHLPAREGMPPKMGSRWPRLARTRILVAMLMLGITTLVGAAPAAQAEEGGVLPDLACTVNFQLNFSPPLTLTNTTANASGNAGVVNCMSPSGAYPDLLSANVTGAGAATSLGGVPCSLLLTVGGTAELAWNTGETSEFDFLINTNPLNGLVTLSGEVTSGPLAGTSIEAVPVLANPNVDCLFVGLTNLTSALTAVAFV